MEEMRIAHRYACRFLLAMSLLLIIRKTRNCPVLPFYRFVGIFVYLGYTLAPKRIWTRFWAHFQLESCKNALLK